MIKIVIFIIICNICNICVLNASAEEWDSATFTLSTENPAAYKGNYTLEVLDFDGYGMAILNISRNGIFTGSMSLENNDTDWYYMDNDRIRIKSENITDRRVMPMFGSINSPHVKFTFATEKTPNNPTSLVLSISTDKKEYLLDQEIIATIDIRNVGDTKANDISLILNSDLLIQGSHQSFDLDDGEQKSLEIKFRFPPIPKASYDMAVNTSWSDDHGARYFIEDSQTVRLKLPLEIRKSATGDVKLGKKAYVSLSVENIQTIPLRVSLSDVIPVSFMPINETITENKADLRWEFDLTPRERKVFTYQMIPLQAGAHMLPNAHVTYIWGREEYTNNSKTENIILVYKGLSYQDQEFGKPDAISVASSPKVVLNTTIRPAISIEVTPSKIDFGTLAPGDFSSENNLSIKNMGVSDISVTAIVTDVVTDVTDVVTDDAGNLYVDGLDIDDKPWKSFSQIVLKNDSKIASIVLKVPEIYEGVGSKEGKLMFWAERLKN